MVRKINKIKLNIQLFSEEQTIETKIKATSDEAIKSLDNVIKKLNKLGSSIDNFNKKLNSENIKKASNEIDVFANKVGKSVVSAQKLVSTLSFSAITAGITRLSGLINDWIYETSDYSEQLNLFNVIFNNIEKNGKTTFSELGKSATQFQYKLNEAFGTNKTETFYMQGMYQAMGEAVNIPDKYSALMSETMTKLTYDMASLYNKQEKDTAEALRAGVYAGQTKPLRAYGIDVTATSMQPILDELGIDRTVKQLSQAEKEIVRYIATLRQANNAMGDFANTIESPANQLKIFKQQLVETKVAITSLAMNIVGNLLPYLNALLMIIKEIAKWLATLFGIQLSDYNSGVASYSDSLDGIKSSADKAGKAVAKMKRQILGFDEVHNINESADSGSGSVGASGGIDKKLLDAIYGYDNGMEKVRMKATEIRDRIMEWLGFTKHINSETGEVSFKLKEGFSNLKLIAGVIGTLIGIKLISKIATLVKSILGVDNLLTLEGKNLTTIGKLIKSLKVNGWGATIAKIGAKLKVVLPIIGKIAVVIGSVVALFKGIKDMYKTVENITQGTQKLKFSVEDLGKAITLTTTGGALLGTLIAPGIGTAIGAVAGALVGLTTAIFGYHKGIENLAKAELFGSLSVSQEQWTEIINNSVQPIDNLSTKLSSLQGNLDTLFNKFKDGNDAVDLFALKFSLSGQKISEEDGKVFLDAVNNIAESSKNIIQQTGDYNLEIMSGIFEKTSTLTEEEEKNILTAIYNSNQDKQKEIDNAQTKITEIYNKGIKKRGYLTDEEYAEIQKQLAKIKSLVDKEMSKSQTDYEYFKQLANDKNLKLDEQSYKDFNTALDNYLEDRKKAISENYNIEYQALKNNLDDKLITEETFNSQIKQLSEQRKKDEETAQKEYEELRKKVYGNLADEYVKIKDSNEKVAKEEKKLIEGIFKNIDIDSKDIIDEFAKIGKNAGKSCALNLSTEMNKTKLKIEIIPTKKQQEDLGLDSKYKIPMTIKGYANGGFPEDGLFFANHKELVGKFSNGKTAVANNDQIIEGIYKGVYSAVLSAMNQTQTSSQIDVHVHTDEGTVVDRINQRTKQTGVFPLNIPI